MQRGIHRHARTRRKLDVFLNTRRTPTFPTSCLLRGHVAVVMVASCCRYKAQMKNPDVHKRVLCLMWLMAQLLRKCFQQACEALHTRVLYAPGVTPYTAVSLTKDYHSRIHVDDKDLPWSFIVWWLEVSLRFLPVRKWLVPGPGGTSTCAAVLLGVHAYGCF